MNNRKQFKKKPPTNLSKYKNNVNEMLKIKSCTFNGHKNLQL